MKSQSRVAIPTVHLPTPEYHLTGDVMGYSTYAKGFKTERRKIRLTAYSAAGEWYATLAVKYRA
jgi:hypothetical protein